MKDPATLVHSVRQRLLAHFEKSAPFAPEAPATEAAPADGGQLLYAPVTGRIRALTRIKDPVFSSEVLGKGYELFVQAGDHVQKGQLLFRFDLQAIAAAGYTLTTPVIVTNSNRFARIEPLLSGRVTAGQQLLRVKM